MTSKQDLMIYAHDAATSHTVAKIATTATAGVGFSTVFGWVEQGVGFAAAMLGIVVTLAIWRKVRLESKESELRIKVLEKRLSES